VVRPEDVRITPPGTLPVDGQIAWPGRVTNAAFRGPRRVIAVKTAVGPITVECAANRAPSTGETVTLLVEMRDVWPIES
jgi:hypothetical protein